MRGLRRAKPAVAAAVAVAVWLILPATSGATVAVVSHPNSLEVTLDSAASSIAISGSPTSITLHELSGQGPQFVASADSGASCQDGGAQQLTCTTSGTYTAILVIDDQAVGPPDVLDASASPVHIESGGVGGLLTAPIEIKGSPFGDRLKGSNEDDKLFGEKGQDEVFGYGGDDAIDAFDEARDQVDCGEGIDTVTADAADTIVNCEDPLIVVDLDADGYRTTEDCDDRDPAVHPGAKEVPANLKDEDCDGKDEPLPDADKDGVSPPTDCDDTNARVRPGATEVLGNAVDENCDGVAAPFPRIDSAVTSAFLLSGDLTRVVHMGVTEVAQGTSVLLACRGPKKSCPFSAKSFSFPAGPRQSVSLDGSFKKRKLKPGTVITVTITAPDTIGRKVEFQTRRRKFPMRTVTCQPPAGTTVPC